MLPGAMGTTNKYEMDPVSGSGANNSSKRDTNAGLNAGLSLASRSNPRKSFQGYLDTASIGDDVRTSHGGNESDGGHSHKGCGTSCASITELVDSSDEEQGRLGQRRVEKTGL